MFNVSLESFIYIYMSMCTHTHTNFVLLGNSKRMTIISQATISNLHNRKCKFQKISVQRGTEHTSNLIYQSFQNLNEQSILISTFYIRNAIHSTHSKQRYVLPQHKIQQYLSLQYLRSNCMGYVDGGNCKLPSI